MFTNRQGLVVYFQHMKNVRNIKRHGHLIYTSKKLKYAVLYVNEEEVDDVKARLKKLPYVTRIDESMKPFIRTEYENSKPDKAKEYDYKYGSI
ncbi:hypothetical protein N781_12830 [Pontibacillus halophilus JSM 076056 = DSM 19796]|uniref:UPF0298 protein N781_12830 n=1 Tax=Pontibacillus halophilus JSM 076056 = DSM 19796 TaxID=1385510 RepID=A0A0A5GQ32_9BACI|nr:DUF2129 domain-containing protein [Pontibacillus halophilus]KGX93285.1 hypothetical protein N781_12830 [Pontibacillus halophilus JSM 076056 = DSM 19796]